MTNAADEQDRALTVSELRERPSVTVEEAAEVLSLGRASAYAAVKRGEIPTVRIGRRLIVPTSALLRLLDA
ncbi:helix-turn-helix domain-containing protein [Aeromicrobium chenweiae]|uniref:DNA-binding protein n=1 Tax=Aeromicrobium chenweiae TaxID=2079793 RepID=A0A2S0WHU7_9ACTN|nr:helix-turn-helix domain-containing protein [Aeromicrobium chenweiae]AWB90864.1 DNA-binding protein [Aeromicrobium chenweiae]TGN32082.1 DNA-binding protein [Aeromicrobium chenweiae]